MPGFELFGKAEREEVQTVLDTGVLMRYGFDGMRKGQWKAKELEEALAKRMQVRHAQLVSSGTAALTVALASAGIGAGDEVIMPTFTFVASFEAIMALSAIPVLVDIDDTLTLDPKAVAKAIGPKTRAIMPVHMCGSMADLRPLKELATTHGLLLIEDACQAIGGSYEGLPLGSYGDVGCFSFDYVKTITCGEGGGIITNNAEIYRNADHYSDHGHDHLGRDRGADEHPFLGYNFRISELNAAVGCAQIKRLDDFLALQKERYTILENHLASIKGVTFRRVPEGGVQNHGFLSVFLPTAAKAKAAHTALGEAGVDACFYWFDNNWHYYREWQHLFQGKSMGPMATELREGVSKMDAQAFPQSDEIMGRTLSFLIRLGWSTQEMEERAGTIAEVLKRI